jgi:2-methylcitrate dehydratase PrpD
MALPAPGDALAEHLGAFACGLTERAPPAAVARIVRRQLLDVTGLCVAARGTDYVEAILGAGASDGACTIIGHHALRGAADAALVNGTAAHGEDYDDTFEGTPVHAGAVVVPAVLAVCESERLGGVRALAGIAAGVELMCRMALVTPTAIHRAGFHPTAVIGALGAALGAGTALGLDGRTLASALGVAGSLACGIIEYLAEGAWTKRLHAGWAAHSGVRAAALARAGFVGPRTVLEGRHGFFHAFTNGDVEPDLSHLRDGLGERWLMEGVAFKPYACGTMAQPFIDCALALRAGGVDPEAVESIECNVGEGTVHRLWEPLAEKHRPANAYAAKFSVPYAVAIALVDGAAGLEQFTDERTRDPRVTALAKRIGYRIDPDDEYPANYTGHLRVRLQSGEEREHRQGHLRGGRHEPLTDVQIAEKYLANARFGGWDDTRAEQVQAMLAALPEQTGPLGLASLRG